MKVLVTGTDGYIGSLLAPLLMSRGHEVTGLDTGFYREGWLYNALPQFPRWIARDVRRIEPGDVAAQDAVVHLAELSNDPLAELDQDLTFRINHEGSVALARLCKDQGVKRFVYSSSCSVYGRSDQAMVTEASPTDPLTAYARCKQLVERDVTALAGDRFSPVFLRNATAYGPSPRMRFDLVLNNLAGLAFTTRKIVLTSDGEPWRPLVHVLDICEAMAAALEAPREAVHCQILNVGATQENYRVRDIAQIVSETIPGCSLTLGPAGGDQRSYRVSFERIREILPSFTCRRTARDGAHELLKVFQRTALSEETFRSRHFTRLRQIRHLLQTGQVDDQLFWRD